MLPRPKTQAQPGSPGACRLWAKPPHRAKPGVVSPELAPVIVFASPDNSVFFPSVRRILCLFLLSPDLSTYILHLSPEFSFLRLMTASLYLHLSFPLSPQLTTLFPASTCLLSPDCIASRLNDQLYFCIFRRLVFALSPEFCTFFITFPASYPTSPEFSPKCPFLDSLTYSPDQLLLSFFQLPLYDPSTTRRSAINCKRNNSNTKVRTY